MKLLVLLLALIIAVAGLLAAADRLQWLVIHTVVTLADVGVAVVKRKYEVTLGWT